MTIRKKSKREAFGRLYVLGGFALVTPSRASGGDTDQMNAPLKHEQESAKVSVVRDCDQERPNGITETRSDEADRQAIECGEDKGMIVDPSEQLPYGAQEKVS